MKFLSLASFSSLAFYGTDSLNLSRLNLQFEMVMMMMRMKVVEFLVQSNSPGALTVTHCCLFRRLLVLQQTKPPQLIVSLIISVVSVSAVTVVIQLFRSHESNVEDLIKYLI